VDHLEDLSVQKMKDLAKEHKLCGADFGELFETDDFDGMSWEDAVESAVKDMGLEEVQWAVSSLELDL